MLRLSIWQRHCAADDQSDKSHPRRGRHTRASTTGASSGRTGSGGGRASRVRRSDFGDRTSVRTSAGADTSAWAGRGRDYASGRRG